VSWRSTLALSFNRSPDGPGVILIRMDEQRTISLDDGRTIRIDYLPERDPDGNWNKIVLIEPDGREIELSSVIEDPTAGLIGFNR
jgi:hypothetical protein